MGLWHRMLNFYFILRIRVLGYFNMRAINAYCKDPLRAQQRFLLARLKENKSTEIGKEYSFGDLHSIAEYRSTFPLVDHSFYTARIARMMEGERNILTVKEICRFGVSSGTTGKPKYIPVSVDQVRILVSQLQISPYASLYQNRKFRSPHKFCNLTFQPGSTMSKSGIPVGPVVPSPANLGWTARLYTTPIQVYQLTHEPTVMYMHALFALREPNLGRINSLFASSVHNLAMVIQSNWEYLIQDIEYGTISCPWLNINDKQLREQLVKLNRPRVQRVESLVAAFRQGTRGLFKRFWPDLNVIVSITSGTQQVHVAHLTEHEAHGMTMFSHGYGASEAMMAVNVFANDLSTTMSNTDQPLETYLPLLDDVFFEFICLADCSRPLDEIETKLITELEVGNMYEVVVTNISGLYRCRMGDIIRIEGLRDNCPKFTFQYRLGSLLNVRGEKTDEAMLNKCLRHALDKLDIGQELEEFTTTDSMLLIHALNSQTIKHSIPEQASSYVLFMQFEEPFEAVELDSMADRLATELDQQLGKANEHYASHRNREAILHPIVLFVHPGSFQSMREYIMTNIQLIYNPLQFKMPRFLKNDDCLRLMWNDRINLS